MFESNINYLAVLTAAVSGMVIGVLWYGPVFGKIWTKLSGFTKEDIEKAKAKGMTKSYLLGFVVQIVTACVLSVIVVAFEATTITQGAMIGFWVWLGFLATSLLNTVIWEGKSVKLYL